MIYIGELIVLIKYITNKFQKYYIFDTNAST